MKADTIIKFIQTLGVNNAHYGGGLWVMSSCPLAPFTHKGGKDSRPSFGITVEPGGGSHFNCFTCHSGNLETLVGTLELYVSQKPEYAPLFNFQLARAYLESDELQIEALEAYQEFKPSAFAEFQEWPQWYLETFMPWWESPRAVQYLRDRGVFPEVADKFDLRYDNQEDRIVCPYRTAFGRLAGMRGRTIGSYGMPHFDYTWNGVNNARLVWYNEPALQLEGPVMVVEGQFDTIRMSQVYPKVLGGLSAKITHEKLQKLETCPGVVFMLDNDQAGQLNTPKYVEYMQKRQVPVGVVEYPDDRKDPDSYSLDELRDLLKDSGLDLLV